MVMIWTFQGSGEGRSGGVGCRGCLWLGVSGFSGGFRTRCEGLIRRVFKIFLLLNEQLAVNRDLCRELSHLGS